ncbi:hypothetical protein FB555_000844 [Alpinimonas psychrophila]|uniref:Uncharacterized protein n=1 Tax=Alpinimonas psychrophila TaxID=748908 RepID=A0A7W3JT59_9MICO|nr:hypothetical protein [Alpinimonas psychrophila]
MKLRNLLITSFSVLAILRSMVHTPPTASAAPGPVVERPASTASEYEAAKVTRVTLPFDHAVSYSDASRIAESLSEPVLAYRFENPQIVGEFTLRSTGRPINSLPNSNLIGALNQRFPA